MFHFNGVLVNSFFLNQNLVHLKSMRNTLFILSSFVFFSLGFAQQKTTVYLFPGQGADARLFGNIEIDTSVYDLHYFEYETPDKKETLQEYAYRFVSEIDTTHDFILLGVSMGGMICTELCDTLKPKQTIIISSAKHRKELPARYRFQRTIPLFRLFPKRALLGGAKVMQPLVEPDRNKHKETFKAMLDAKDPLYMKRTIGMIISWEKETFSEKIIHIHGDADHTIPIRNVNADYIIESGSHMMTLTNSDAVNKILFSLI